MTDHPKTPGQAVNDEMARQLGDASATWPWDVDAIAQAAIQASGLVEIAEHLVSLHDPRGGVGFPDRDVITKARAALSTAPPARSGEDAVGTAEREVGRYIYRRIEALMDAKAGTPEGDELSFLAAIAESVEEYGEAACAAHPLGVAPPARQALQEEDIRPELKLSPADVPERGDTEADDFEHLRIKANVEIEGAASVHCSVRKWALRKLLRAYDDLYRVWGQGSAPARQAQDELREERAVISQRGEKLPMLCYGERVWVRATVEDPGSKPGDEYGRNVTVRFDGPFKQTAVVYAGEIEHWPTGRIFSWAASSKTCSDYMSAEKAAAARANAELVEALKDVNITSISAGHRRPAHRSATVSITFWGENALERKNRLEDALRALEAQPQGGGR